MNSSTKPAKPILAPEDQAVSFAELFFDLVFVFSVTQVVHLLHGAFDWVHVGRAILVCYRCGHCFSFFYCRECTSDIYVFFLVVCHLLCCGPINWFVDLPMGVMGEQNNAQGGFTFFYHIDFGIGSCVSRRHHGW